MSPHYNSHLTRGTRDAFVACPVNSTPVRSTFNAMQTHVIGGNFVEPGRFGESFKLSPVVVLLSLTFWGSLRVRDGERQWNPL